MSGSSKTPRWGLAFGLALMPALLLSAPLAAQTATNLNCAGCVTTRNIQTEAVNTSRIEDGAVTNRKISSRSIRSGSLGTDSVNSRVLAPDAVFSQTIIVRSDGNARENCSGLIEALNDITDSGPQNAFLVIVEPGRYDCGNRTVKVPRYVDLQGSGEDITRIRGERNSRTQGVVELTSPAELRFITVEHLGSSRFDPAIAVSGIGERVSLRAVTAISGPNLATISTAVFARPDSFISVRDSRVISNQTAFNADTGATINVVNTEITTPRDQDNSIGDINCLNAYDAELFLLSSSCQ